MAQQIVDDGNGHNVPLRSYVERIFDEREKALALAFDAQQRLREVRSRARGAEAVPRTGAVGFSALLALISGAAGAVLGVVIERAIGG